MTGYNILADFPPFTVIKIGVWLVQVSPCVRIMVRLGLGLALDYGLGFSSDIRLRQDPQLRVSHLATTSRVLISTGV